MKPEIKEKWLAALRSGEYEQGRSWLRSLDNKYCCLGVLCDIYAKENKMQWSQTHASFKFFTLVSSIPDKVQNWSGVDDFGTFKGNSLANMNDNGSTFLEIAEVIEKNF